MTASTFQENLLKGDFFAVLSQFLPPDVVWRQEVDPTKLAKFDFGKLAEFVVKEAGKDVVRANKKFAKGKHAECLKTLIHCLRMIEVTFQIQRAQKDVLNLQEICLFLLKAQTIEIDSC